MNLSLLKSFFLWNTILSFGLLIIWTLAVATSSDFIFEMHGKLFSISRERFDAIIYAMIGLFKILTLTFNVIPLITIAIMSKRKKAESV